MAAEGSSFLLRTLTGAAKSTAGANTKPTQVSRLTRIVSESSPYVQGRKVISFIWRWGGSISWVVATTVLVLVFPLSLEISREFDLGQLEQQIMVGYQAQGYPPQQLQAMQVQGQFGIPPMPPPQQPLYP